MVVFYSLVFHIIDLILSFMYSTVVLCKLFFISVSESFLSDWSFFMLFRFSLNSLGILITCGLNSACDRSPFCLVLFLEF